MVKNDFLVLFGMTSLDERVEELKLKLLQQEQAGRDLEERIRSLSEAQKMERGPLEEELRQAQQKHRQELKSIRTQYVDRRRELEQMEEQDISNAVSRQQPIEECLKQKIKAMKIVQRKDMGSLERPKQNTYDSAEKMRKSLRL